MSAFETITATFRIVTPMFLGDAERNATRLSLQSFKGQLRWWWRAHEFPLCLDNEGDEAAALRELSRRESLLFGTAGDEAKSEKGQARILMRLMDTRLDKSLPTGTALRGGNGPVGPGARYLGYGLMGAFGARQGQLERSCIPAGGEFTVALGVRPPPRRKGESPEAYKERAAQERDRLSGSMISALRFLGLLGGLGSRNRRGWGSLSLQKLTRTVGRKETKLWRPPGTTDAYAAALKEALKEIRPLLGRQGEPPFSAFSGLSRVEIVHTGNDALKVLDETGRQLVRYRAWGYNGRLPDGTESERNFKPDHDWAKSPWQGEGRRFVPARAAFGLPHNYGPKCHNAGVTPLAREAGDRRASPFLIHIHQLDEGRYAAVVVLLPARFVPGGKVAVKWDRGGYEAPLPANWVGTLTGLLDGLPGRPPYFPDRTPILFPAVERKR